MFELFLFLCLQIYFKIFSNKIMQHLTMGMNLS